MKKIKILLGIAMVASVLTIPVHGAEGDTTIPVISETPQITPAETPVRELRVEGNKISYYYKGKMVRNKWKRYEGYKYYFGEDGYACIGGSKIGNKVYVFDKNGHLLENQMGKMRIVLNKSIVSLQIMVNRKQDILFIIMIYIMRILKGDVIRIVHGKMDSYTLHQVEKRERIQMHC